MNPNIFQFATSELSQDAFFCWLISWAEEKHRTANSNMFIRSEKFLKQILPKEIYTPNFVVKSVKVLRQYKKIDFLVILNDSIILLFEDKIKSKNHSDQLKRYSELIKSEFKEKNIINIYIKTDYIWKAERNSVLKNDYITLDIVDISNSLIENSENDIYDDFVQNINQRLSSYQSYSSTPKNKWEFEQWLGFFHDLTKSIAYVNFGKFHSGTKTNWFIISWKSNIIEKNCSLSLEIFGGKLLVKAHIDGSVNKNNYKSQVTASLMPHFKSFNCKKSNKTGKITTLFVIENFEVLNKETLLIDYDQTVLKLKEIIQIFDNFK